MDRSKIIKMTIILAAITVLCGAATRIIQNNSMSLAEYEALHNTTSATDETAGDASGDSSAAGSASGEANGNTSAADNTASASSNAQESAPTADETAGSTAASALTGAALNGDSEYELRVTYADGFYYEPLSDALKHYMTGVSYPAEKSADSTQESPEQSDGSPAITLDELRYVHLLHYDFDGEPVEGELVCNAAIAQELIEIFYQLYRNEYQLESVLLIDEFDGDDLASMEANNTSCFNYRVVEGSTKLSKHAYGLAVDINPFYNPYIKYEKDGTETISPVAAAAYTDRSAGFSYKIDENDLCYKLFTQYGFTWGGNWNSVKDYQHFQKALD